MAKKKLLAALLCMVMVIGILPAAIANAAPVNPFTEDFEGAIENQWGTVGNQTLIGSTGVFADLGIDTEENGNKYLRASLLSGSGNRGNLKEFDSLDCESMNISFDYLPESVGSTTQAELRFYSSANNNVLFALRYLPGSTALRYYTTGSASSAIDTGYKIGSWLSVDLAFDFVNHTLQMTIKPRDDAAATPTVYSNIPINANAIDFNRLVFIGVRSSGNVACQMGLDNFKTSYVTYANNKILSFAPMKNLTVAEGEAIVPATSVNVLMGDGTTKDIPVTNWTCSPAFDPALFIEYTYTGTLAPQNGEDNFRNLKPTFKVEYRKYHYPVSLVNPVAIELEFGQPLPEFPQTVTAKMSNGEWAEMPVGAWTATRAFNAEQEGVSIYTAQLVALEGQYEIKEAVPVKDRTATLYVNYFTTGNNYNGYARSMEWLDRGVVALKSDNGIFVSWRISATEYGKNLTFNVYRNGKIINSAPVVGKTNFADPDGKPGDIYKVETIVGVASSMSKEVAALEHNYLSIPLQTPDDRAPLEGGQNRTVGVYSANDSGVADVDGDGEYEILVKWYPSNAVDSASAQMTSPTYFDCYKLDGTVLWRIDLGYNITSGAHYSQFLFYDFNQDGKAEFLVKSADATTVYKPNAQGKIDMNDPTTVTGVVGDPTKNGAYCITTSTGSYGHISGGPEYFVAFEGATGRIMDVTDYDAPLGNVSSWGDSSYNRSDRYNAGICYIPLSEGSDQIVPAAVMNRGYYARTYVAAYVMIGEELQKVWTFDSAAYPGYTTTQLNQRGNHQVACGDLDNDGYDEYLMGSIALDHDGTLLWVKDGNNGLPASRHGDTLHMSVMMPDSNRLQFYNPYESTNDPFNHALSDAATGAVIFGVKIGDFDAGRGVAANITPTPGFEFWSQRPGNETPNQVPSGMLYNVYGEVVAETKAVNFSCNWRAYWDGDLLSELPDGRDIGAPNGTTEQSVYKYNWENNTLDLMTVFEGTLTNNGTKNTPNLTADIFGDWREEIVARSTDSSELRVYSTTIETEYMIYSLMHDPVYRLAVANQNTSYNQPPALGFYLGEDIADKVLAMDLPTYNIYYTDAPVTAYTSAASYEPNADIIVNVTTGSNVEYVHLVNETDSALASNRTVVDNGDGTKTWTLTLSLGTSGKRTLKVYADRVDTGVEVKFLISATQVVAPPVAGEQKAISVTGPSTALINTPFTATIVTTQTVSYVRLYNESGTSLAASSLTYTDNADGTRTWLYTTNVGSTGKRVLNVRIAGADKVYTATDVNYSIKLTK